MNATQTTKPCTLHLFLLPYKLCKECIKRTKKTKLINTKYSTKNEILHRGVKIS